MCWCVATTMARSLSPSARRNWPTLTQNSPVSSFHVTKRPSITAGVGLVPVVDVSGGRVPLGASLRDKSRRTLRRPATAGAVVRRGTLGRRGDRRVDGAVHSQYLSTLDGDELRSVAFGRPMGRTYLSRLDPDRDWQRRPPDSARRMQAASRDEGSYGRHQRCGRPRRRSVVRMRSAPAAVYLPLLDDE